MAVRGKVVTLRCGRQVMLQSTGPHHAPANGKCLTISRRVQETPLQSDPAGKETTPHPHLIRKLHDATVAAMETPAV
jgi:hypothetical protein